MTRPIFVLLGGAMLLASCGGSGGSANSSAAAGSAAPSGALASSVAVPAAFAGTWGADCASPFVSFTPGMIHVFPDNADYALKSVAPTENSITVGYDTKQGAVSEVYEMEGGEMRLTRGAYSGQEATWDKAPMKKCS